MVNLSVLHLIDTVEDECETVLQVGATGVTAIAQDADGGQGVSTVTNVLPPRQMWRSLPPVPVSDFIQMWPLILRAD